MKDQSIYTMIAGIVFSVALVAIAGMAYMSYAQMQRNQAVESCFTAATVESTRAGEGETRDIKITEPVKDIYKYCLEDKGYTPTQK